MGPKRNIKGEGEILEYIKELEGDTSWRSWCSNWANKFKNIKDITITQEDINDYISEAKIDIKFTDDFLNNVMINIIKIKQIEK